MISSPKILITGASGFTGQHACRYFCSKGYQVIAVANKHLVDHEDPNMDVRQCDLKNQLHVETLMESVNPDYLLHLAGLNNIKDSWENPLLSLELNFMSTAYLIDAVRNKAPDCKILIVGSALQFDPNNLSTLHHPYSLSKTLQVLISRSWQSLYNLPLIIANPTNLIGPGNSNGVCSIIAKKIVESEHAGEVGIIQLDNPLVERDFLDVRDAVTAYEILLNCGERGQIYDLSSGQSRSLGEIVEIYSTLTPIEVEMQSFQKGKFSKLITITPTKLMRLGWQPTTMLTNSLKDTLEYHRNRCP
jgi:GDP-4-dehydro-6-deoxy-D-mannose reductase